MPRLTRRELQARRQLKKQKRTETPPPQELAPVGAQPSPTPSSGLRGEAKELGEGSDVA